MYEMGLMGSQRTKSANVASRTMLYNPHGDASCYETAVRMTQNNETLVFRHIGNGDHRMRAVIDSDGNGVWTPGDYRKQRQPEEQILYDKTLQMREKWELEERWTVERPVTLLLSTPKADTDQIIGITPMRP